MGRPYKRFKIELGRGRPLCLPEIKPTECATQVNITHPMVNGHRLATTGGRPYK